MKRRSKIALAAILASMMAIGARAQTAPLPSESNFQVKTTSDLVRLCESKPTDATGVAALHFCHGFVTGAYQYYQVAAAASGKRLVCVPTPPPSRNEAIAAFVTWTRQNPQPMSMPPIEGLFQYLAQRYPCRA